jgi:lipopolysaccharide export LptBFGC system permease protein LptF
MVFTLQRYIFREVFRIFVLATVGLTLILSLGLILRPVQEYGVGPKQVLHILVYFMPVTLTFVLPMAALFACALAYGRFASDNELNACRASGIGLWTFVYPGLALAILVAIANLLLSFHVMPYFVHLAESSLKADAKQILFRNLQRRGFYELPALGGDRSQYRIYADYADPQNDTLYGIIVVEAGRDGISKTWTAERATIGFDLHEKLNEVQLSICNARIMPAGEGVSGLIVQSSFRRSFPRLLRDNIKFKRLNEMKQIREDLTLFEPIAGRVQSAYQLLVTDLLVEDIGRTVNPSGTGYYELRGPTQWIRFSAAMSEHQARQTIRLIGPVITEEYDIRSGRLLRRLRCDGAAALHVGKETPYPGLSLDLPNARNLADDSLETLHLVNDLSLPYAVRLRLGHGDPLQTVLKSEQILGATPSSSLADELRTLKSEMDDTLVDIKTEMNTRLVFGIGCIPMILIGMGLGIINRGGHLLSAFGASCAPAAILIITLASGRQLTGSAGDRIISGIGLMWSGLAFLAFVTMLIYRKLLRT